MRSHPPGTSTPAELAGLLDRVADGDDAAFDMLYAATRATVERIVQRTTQAFDHTPEVVQEVYLHVWEHPTSFDPARASVLGWLAMLAHRRAVDRVRQVARARARDEQDAALARVEADDASELGVSRLLCTQVRAALHGLRGAEREAVVLTFLHGHTHRQAAQLLAIPEGTLKTRVRTGLIRLRAQLVEPAA